MMPHRRSPILAAIVCGATILSNPALSWALSCSPVGGGGPNTGGGATVNTGEASIASTDQAVEQVRQRREQQATVSMFASGSPVVRASLTPSATATAPAAPAASAPRRARARATAANRPAAATGKGVRGYLANRRTRRERYEVVEREPTYAYGYGEGLSLKDSPPPVAENGAWAAGYGDWERHTNLNPGQSNNPTRTQTTGGFISGIDRTFTPWGGYGSPVIQLGLLAGYNYTRSSFTSNPSGINGAQIDDGGFVGVYGSYIVDRFAADLIVKTDFYNHRQDPSFTCPTGSVISADSPSTGIGSDSFISGDTSNTNVNVSSNVYYRFDLANGYWLEPTAGFRYLHSSYGDIAAALGLQDGDLWRIQGGLRIGTGGFFGGYRWTASVLGLLYDNVSISGFTLPLVPTASGTARVDEGKLRGLGQFFGRVDAGQGLSYLVQLEVRGGDDIIGFGGKVGLRYEW